MSTQKDREIELKSKQMLHGAMKEVINVGMARNKQLINSKQDPPSRKPMSL